ncbi:hypothetical protein LOTGIDRAFT_164755 [Lottia gigantea]|uniref:Sushi domain-containing protein n=1 Tax=Lottia gigantea TaxID=225164 RepID=V3ZF01_LOTGI|nr:hypothetical protein LOTGIDRAFT_164755 [Lottia gigantea]ESO89733.1 hypothetical protein LOTGIDRAFT_164755 [Lottia gigantea]
MPNCPRLADPQPVIITIKNAAELKLSNYDTSLGTVTEISCLGYPEYIPIGPKSLKCLSSGSWNDSIPTCEAARFVTSTTTTIEESDPTVLVDSDISMLPIICVAVLLALVFLVLVILVACTVRFWKKPKSPQTEASTFSERNSQLRRSEPNLYSRPPTMFNTRQYADSWDSVSVDFDRRGGAVPDGDAGYDFIYNGSIVTAINSNTGNGRPDYRNSSPKHWSNSFSTHAYREPKQGLQNRPHPDY